MIMSYDPLIQNTSADYNSLPKMRPIYKIPKIVYVPGKLICLTNVYSIAITTALGTHKC